MGHRFLIGNLFDNFIKLLPASYREEMFYRIGRILGVRSFTYENGLGIFEGSINDKVVHRYYLTYGTWAPGLQYLISNLFSDGPGTFIDIGANIGLISIPIAKKNNKIDVYAFEPEINNYNFLRKNIIANGLEMRIKTFNLALFSEDCILDMELSKDNMGDHRVQRQSISNPQNNYFSEESRQIVKTQANKLDGLLNAHDLIKPIILKIDTQGAEVQVFLGAANFLLEADYLIVEYWPYGLQRMADTTDSFSRIIRQFPFGALCDADNPIVPNLLPINDFLESLDTRLDKIGIDHLDILLSRHPQLPKAKSSPD